MPDERPLSTVSQNVGLTRYKNGLRWSSLTVGLRRYVEEGPAAIVVGLDPDLVPAGIVEVGEVRRVDAVICSYVCIC